MCQSKFDLIMLWGTSLAKIEGLSAGIVAGSGQACHGATNSI